MGGGAPKGIANRRALLVTVSGKFSVPHLQQILLAWDQWVKGKSSRAHLYAPFTHTPRALPAEEASKGPTVAASREGIQMA